MTDDVRPWRPEDGDARCQRCGRVNGVWRTTDEVWNDVMGGGEVGILCPVCFMQAAEARGIGRRGAWLVLPFADYWLGADHE